MVGLGLGEAAGEALGAGVLAGVAVDVGEANAAGVLDGLENTKGFWLMGLTLEFTAFGIPVKLMSGPCGWEQG